MQIREQGRQVQLIRSPYDPEKKRCVQKVAHTFKQQYLYSSDDINKYLSAEQVLDLSDIEKKQLSDWLRTRADKNLADARRSKISYSDKYISAVADAVLSDGVSVEQAAKIWAAMDKLAKQLKKSGHPKSSAKVQSTSNVTEQPGLDLDPPSSSLPPGECHEVAEAKP